MISGATQPTLVVRNSGVYKVVESDTSGCHVTSNYVTVIHKFIVYQPIPSTLKMSENDESTFVVFPNPNNGTFLINVNDDELLNIELFDVYGREISDRINCVDNGSSQKNVILQNISSGTYFLHLMGYQQSSIIPIVVTR